MEGERLTFLPMGEEHLDGCAAIAATAPDPWSTAALARSLKDAHSLTMVALLNGQPLAFASFFCVEDSCDLQLVAVHPNARRKGVATALLRHSLPLLKRREASRVLLEVRQGNTAAQSLYATLGFKPLARRPGMYSHPVEDGLLMALTL